MTAQVRALTPGGHPVCLPGARGTQGSVEGERVSAESKECDHLLSEAPDPYLASIVGLSLLYFKHQSLMWKNIE